MIRLAVDDEARALSAWKHAEVLYVGEDVVFAPQWARYVWKAADGRLYFVRDNDLAQMQLGIADIRELY